MNILLILLALPVVGIGAVVLFFTLELRAKNKRHEREVGELTRELTAAKVLLGAQTEKFNDTKTSGQFEKYAGLVLTHIHQGIIVIDNNRNVVLINPYAMQFIDKESPIGLPYKEILRFTAGAGISPDLGIFETAFGGHMQTLPDTWSIVCRRGAFPVSGTVAPLTTDHHTGMVVFVFSDSSRETERIKEEQAFFSAAAHELRTPLSIIRLTTSLLREQFNTLPKEKIEEHLARTDETTVRLVKLVNDFLNVSRIDQGRLELAIEPFDIVALSDEAIKDHMMLAGERKLYVHHEPTDVLERTVVGDRAKAKEVLSNLVSNAIKYTIQGGVTMTHEVANSSLATHVTDTGPGIPLEYQKLLFRRFQQVGQAKTQAPTKSSGLGLYISKKLAILMHGDVILTKSEPGKGSTFTFTLPLGGKTV